MIKFLTRRRNLLCLLAMSVAVNLATFGFNLYNISSYRDGPLLMMINLSLANLASVVACAWGWAMVYRIKDAT